MKPISERRPTDELTEDEILEEYADVIERLKYIDSNILHECNDSCTIFTYYINLYAKVWSLKDENVDTFFEHVINDDYLYEEFRANVNEQIPVEFPDLKYNFEPKNTGFYGRSGGHFRVYFEAPSSVSELQRYLEGFVAYDLADINYEVVQEFVDNIEATAFWLNKYMLDYWNGVCENIREDQEAEKAFAQRFRCPKCEEVLETVRKIITSTTVSVDASLGFDRTDKPALIEHNNATIIMEDSKNAKYCCPKCGYSTQDPDEFIKEEMSEVI